MTLSRFTALHRSFFEGVAATFRSPATIEASVHVEVRKFHPDTGLRSFRPARDTAEPGDEAALFG